MNQKFLHDEGVVKYQCTWDKQPAGADWDVSSLNRCREWLFKEQFIGINTVGIGYGNISYRYNKEQFIISGSSTGHLPQLDQSHYSMVTSFNLDHNHLFCTGPCQASSESMSHGTLYRLNSDIGAVVHVHHEKMWHYYNNMVPTTNPEVPYGTPAMAHEIERIYFETPFSQQKFMVMGGHFEGMVTFGATIDDALASLKKYYNDYIESTR